MRWSSQVAVLIMVALAAAAGGTLSPTAQAQDATPASEQAAGTRDTGTFRELASGSIEVLAPGTANVAFGRVTLARDASVAFDPNNSSAILVYIAAGTVTFKVDAEMTVSRGEAADKATPVEPESVAANAEFTLREGDSAVFPPAVAGEARNDGHKEAVAWVATFAHVAKGAATPTP